jgi:hypothetical protein
LFELGKGYELKKEFLVAGAGFDTRGLRVMRGV